MYKRIGLSSSTKLKVFKRDRFTCTYCGVSGADAELHVDHIIPVSKGGSNNIYNLTTACSRCNLQKADKIIHRPPSKEAPKTFRLKCPESSLLEKAETILLRIYLHCTEHRPQINQTLIGHDLLFGFAQHRLLWQIIDTVTTQHGLASDPDNRLLDFVQNQYLEHGLGFDAIQPLFQLTETTAEDLFRANIRIPEAIAVMETVAWEKYGNYCLKQLQQLTPQSKDFQYYQHEWMKARQEIQRLNNQRLKVYP